MPVEMGEARCVVLEVGEGARNPARELIEYLLKISAAEVRLEALGVSPSPAALPSGKREEEGSNPSGVEDKGRTSGVGEPVHDDKFAIILGGGEDVERAGQLGIEVEKANWRVLSADRYLVRSSGQALLLAGKSELSLFNGMEEFLKKHLGVRWFMPGEIGEVVPSSPTVKIGQIDEVGEPGFRWRWVGSGEWARRVGMNVGVECPGEFKTKWFAHTFSWLLPPERYAAAHPEYYALIDGRRTGGSVRPNRLQLCTSNPEVVREAAANIVKTREQEPDLRMVSLDPMDSQEFCQCDRCRALDEPGAGPHNAVSRRLALFYGQVADLVRARYPDLLLKSIAYHKYAAPPVDPGVRLGDTNVIQLCHFMCHNHALTDPACPYNVAYNQYLKGWQRICPNVAMYEYFNKVSWLELPWPVIHTIRQDIPYLKNLGLFGLATQYAENFGSNGLVYYIAAKLLWDPDADVDALLEDFYTRFYAEAAGPMREYYETLEKAAVASGVHLARQRPYREVVHLFTPGLWKDLDRCVSAAEGKAQDEKVRKRIALVRASLDYAKVCSAYLRELDRVRGTGPHPWVGHAAEVRAWEVGRPYLQKIRDALERGKKIRATGGPDNPYIQRLLDPARVVREWDKADYGFPEEVRTMQKRDWLRERGLAAGKAPLPKKISVWVVGYDFDASRSESECAVWTLGHDGRKVVIGGLARPGDSGDKRDRCYASDSVETEAVLPQGREKVALSVTNPAGRWTDADVYAVYVMPWDEDGGRGCLDWIPGQARNDGDEEAMRRIEKEIDAVRERALGFVEFHGSGVSVPDGGRVALEIEVAR
jgi:hypothetical protein